MAPPRPFPPSPRRRELARSSGLHAASPMFVGALACAATVLAIAQLGRVATAGLGTWIAAACEGRANTPGFDDVVAAIVAIAMPSLVAAALAAMIAHVAQTRALWLPRRRLANAPELELGRGTHASFGLASAFVIGAVAIGWLWLMAPRLASLSRSPRAGGLLVLSFVAALAVVWVVLGTIEALVRHGALTRSMRMTAAEKREDDRLASADPRWRARRAAVASGPSTAHDLALGVAGASVLLLGDDTAIAIAWDPRHRPVPVRSASGRTARATQLLGLARRHSIPVHRDAELAALLIDGDGPVAETYWPRLAEIIAATRGRSR